MSDESEEMKTRIPAGTNYIDAIRFICDPIKSPLPIPSMPDISALTTSFTATFTLTEDQCDDLRLMCGGFARVQAERLKALKRRHKTGV